MTSPRHLVLIGLMGAGKTTVGEECARRLGRPFVDTDDVVQASTGRSVSEVFAVEGEAGFRAYERVAVADAGASPAPLVIACGGGAVLDPDSRRLLRRRGCVVWLLATPAALAARVGGHAVERPLLPASGAVLTLERLAAARAPAYRAAAHAEVETTGRTVDQVADAVLEEMGRCAG
jgi:shikimate kinase